MIADSQVLICPLCQQSFDWRADLDSCGQCGGTRLVRRLGETACLDCQHTGPGRPAGPLGALPPTQRQRPLAAQVETALRRLLNEPPA
ncbi:MAG: hypothetical protein ABI912_02930 [Actinomycetota bacterium]